MGLSIEGLWMHYEFHEVLLFTTYYCHCYYWLFWRSNEVFPNCAQNFLL